MNKYLSFLLLLFTLGSCVTRDTCASVHTGNFYYYLFSGKEKITVIRTDNMQVETNNKGIEMATPIKWTGPCNFDMLVKPTPEVLQAFKVKSMPGITVHVEIVKVSGDYYISEANASYEGKKFLEKRDTLYFLNK